MWIEEIENVRCAAVMEVLSNVTDQYQCQASCEATPECVGISYSHKVGFTQYCQTCSAVLLTPDPFNGFGFYKRKIEKGNTLWIII